MNLDKLGEGLVFWITVCFFISLAAVPLAIWKLVDIAIWAWNKLEITIKILHA